MEREYGTDGRQFVEVTGFGMARGLGYQWDGSPPLSVGDMVWVPENWVSNLQYGAGPWRGKVTALGTVYDGALSRILRRVED